MAGVKDQLKRYVAVVGIDFEGLKDKPRVDAGETIPAGIDPKVIADLLANGDIKEVE
jgi:hypothetical protein